MTREAIDIILKIWEAQGPFEYKGKFWNVNIPDTMYGTLKYFLKPYQTPPAYRRRIGQCGLGNSGKSPANEDSYP